MNEIEVISKIKREKLEERNYFKTLIEEAYFNQMITDDYRWWHDKFASAIFTIIRWKNT